MLNEDFTACHKFRVGLIENREGENILLEPYQFFSFSLSKLEMYFKKRYWPH